MACNPLNWPLTSHGIILRKKQCRFGFPPCRQAAKSCWCTKRWKATFTSFGLPRLSKDLPSGNSSWRGCSLRDFFRGFFWQRETFRLPLGVKQVTSMPEAKSEGFSGFATLRCLEKLSKYYPKWWFHGDWPCYNPKKITHQKKSKFSCWLLQILEGIFKKPRNQPIFLRSNGRGSGFFCCGDCILCWGWTQIHCKFRFCPKLIWYDTFNIIIIMAPEMIFPVFVGVDYNCWLTKKLV